MKDGICFIRRSAESVVSPKHHSVVNVLAGRAWVLVGFMTRQT